VLVLPSGVIIGVHSILFGLMLMCFLLLDVVIGAVMGENAKADEEVVAAAEDSITAIVPIIIVLLLRRGSGCFVIVMSFSLALFLFFVDC